jgi:hypothetical protein
MKKFIRENWFKMGIIIALLIVALSAAYYFVIFLPIQQQPESLPGQNQVGDIDLQVKCADGAAKLFKQLGYDSSKGTDSYTNHWNKNLEKCFMLIQSSANGTIYEYLTDVFEIKTYGATWRGVDALGDPSTIMLSCEMYKDGNQSSLKNCHSEIDFESFVKSYMEE